MGSATRRLARDTIDEAASDPGESDTVGDTDPAEADSVRSQAARIS
jgi:hypothetical protein